MIPKAPKAKNLHLNLEFINIYFTYLSFTKIFELPKCSCNSLNLRLLNDFFLNSKIQDSALSHKWQTIANSLSETKRKKLREHTHGIIYTTSFFIASCVEKANRVTLQIEEIREVGPITYIFSRRTSSNMSSNILNFVFEF